MPESNEHLPLTLDTFLYVALEPKQDHCSSYQWVVRGFLVPLCLPCPCAPALEVLGVTCARLWQVWFIPIISTSVILLAAGKLILGMAGAECLRLGLESLPFYSDDLK